MYVIAGIDGTGAYNDAEYSRHFRNSYVKQFSSNVGPPSFGHYQRGPSMEGASTKPRGEEAARQLVQALAPMQRKGAKVGVFLTGFSRGGAAAIWAARVLADSKITVDAMFLFDAVDRAVGLDVDAVSPNVRSVYHARRSTSAESREFFGNCGVRYHKGSTVYHSKWFHCTHGAVGGTPWTSAGSDGKIYEGNTTISHGMMILLPMPLSVLARSQHHANKTKVTLEQEKSGSAKVFDWMSGHFEAEKQKAMLRNKYRDVAADRSNVG
ncbi:hypothetical protein [Hoeflea ulvae]|uniref:DUF2235 domain-containing protein n=1 Tax=Hoeflea ulvae TaxID=2983764 RepID=A0ABT3YH07_9HYPH|nr:hypothetical protein [Hoeflea ulvae]MCY0095184.1 hypothetical protein [Hoeflea ulvae]